MPTLKQITASLELGPNGAKLKEYGHRYTDGGVEAFIAVPETDLPFHIHVTSSGYIAPGLAAYVYMDGEYQCNRNRQRLQIPAPGMASKEFEVDFNMRQKEEKSADGLFVAREWTFSRLKTGKLSATWLLKLANIGQQMLTEHRLPTRTFLVMLVRLKSSFFAVKTADPLVRPLLPLARPRSKMSAPNLCPNQKQLHRPRPLSSPLQGLLQKQHPRLPRKLPRTRHPRLEAEASEECLEYLMGLVTLLTTMTSLATGRDTIEILIPQDLSWHTMLATMLTSLQGSDSPLCTTEPQCSIQPGTQSPLLLGPNMISDSGVECHRRKHRLHR